MLTELCYEAQVFPEWLAGAGSLQNLRIHASGNPLPFPVLPMSFGQLRECDTTPL